MAAVGAGVGGESGGRGQLRRKVGLQPFPDGVSALTWLDGLFPEGGVQSWPEFSGARKERGWQSKAAKGCPSQSA